MGKIIYEVLFTTGWIAAVQRSWINGSPLWNIWSLNLPRLGRKGRNNVVKCVFITETCRISIQMPLKCVPADPMYNKLALFEVMGAMASKITGGSIVYSTACSGADRTKTSKLRVTGFCEGNPPVTGEYPAQRASNAENVSICFHLMYSWGQTGTRRQYSYIVVS